MNRSALVVPILLGALLVVSSGAIYFYRQANIVHLDPKTAAQEEAAVVVAKVAKLTLLPEGEIPTVATVSDPKKLQDQIFFKNADAGDKVLVYTQAKMVYLYNPKENKVINVAPLTIGMTEAR